MRVSDERLASRPSSPPPTKPAAAEPLFLDRRGAARLLGVNVQIVDRMIREEALPASRLGRRILIRRDRLLAAVEASPVWEARRG